MPPFKKHTQLGFRWLKCGWRLFVRNPWLLGGMGACAAAALFVVSLVPMIGSPLTGLLVPTFLASFYIAIDGVAKQRAKLPPALRAVAFKHSPKEFLNLAREDNRLLQVVLLGLYSLAVVVVADILAWLMAGTAWANRSLDMHYSALPVVALVGLILFAIYLLLAASLVYALPLALLQNQPLVPAVTESFKRSVHYAFALLTIVALAVAPFLLGALLSLYSRPLGVSAALLALAVVVPVAACSLYCSFRTVFPAADTANLAVDPPLRSAKTAS